MRTFRRRLRRRLIFVSRAAGSSEIVCNNAACPAPLSRSRSREAMPLHTTPVAHFLIISDDRPYFLAEYRGRHAAEQV